MQAETRTLTHLFQLDVQYVIPLYQRPYVWTEDKQWAPLWEDIATVADHVFTEGASAKSPSHFMGAIVIQQQENPPGSPQRFLVIDGQQRLTTLQLLLVAAARTAEAMGCPDEGKLLLRLTANDPLLAKGEDRFKVWPTNANRLAFKTVMDPGGSPDKAPDDPNNEIQEAYNFFCKQIQLWVSDDGSDGPGSSPDSQFHALRVSLSDLLKLVAIRLEDGDSPQVIFETLNGRGTPLIALDLLKNAVFLEAARENANTDELYTEHWEPELDRDYWREDRRAGRLFTKNGDMFLQYWLVAELAEPVPSTELFDIFRAKVLQPATCLPMAELIPALARDAATMRRFQSSVESSPERRFFELLELLDTTTLMPIVLLLLRSNQISAERRANAFAVLESFLVRRMLCGWTTKNYNRLTAALVGEIKKDLAHADTVLQKRLTAEGAPANRWPRDDDLRVALLNKDMYGQRRQDRLVMVLWRIEEHLRAADSKVEQGLAVPSNLTLEHLIPQSWEAHWPLDEGNEDPLAWRNAHIHKLGNLTLTTGPLNSSLSNSPWHAPDAPKDKRHSLVQHSLLKLNTTVVHNYSEHFDEHAVDDRGAFLTELITQLWPGPPASTQPIAGDEKSTDESTIATTTETASQRHNGTEPPIVASRDAIREQLQQGATFEEICNSAPDKRAAYLTAIEEEARLAGELNKIEPNAANAASLRDERHLRWERIAARLFGDARRVDEAQRLYDEARGGGAAKRSYTGKGRHFPDMDPRSHDAAAGEPSQAVDAVAGQSAWSSREVDAATSAGPMTDKSQLYWDFWEKFRDRVDTEHPEWKGRAGPSRTASNSCLPTGAVGTIFCSVFKRDGMRFELAFVRPDAAVNLARFEALHAKKIQFEEALGESAVWDEMPGAKDTRVYVISPFDRVDDRVQWPAMIDWLIDQHVRFKRAIQAVGGLGI